MLMTKFQVITNKYLEIRTLDFGSFVYNISTAPVHGWISVLAPNKVCNNQPSQCFFFPAEQYQLSPRYRTAAKLQIQCQLLNRSRAER